MLSLALLMLLGTHHAACGGVDAATARVGPASVELWPVVSWRGHTHRFDDERVHNNEIVDAAAIGDRCALFFDSAVESPGWEIVVATSADGSAWKINASVRKPYYLATFAGVSFADARHGCMRVHLDDDVGSGVAVGDYRSCTVDGGASWSAFARSLPSP